MGCVPDRQHHRGATVSTSAGRTNVVVVVLGRVWQEPEHRDPRLDVAVCATIHALYQHLCTHDHRRHA